MADMRCLYVIVYVLSHFTMCRPSTTDPPTTDHHQTSTAWYTTEEIVTIGSTRLPQFLRLGNQTVDINKSFRVPQADVIKTETKTTSVEAHTVVSEVVRKVTNVSEIVKQIQGATLSPPRSWQGTKHEHEGRYGPKFEDAQAGDNLTMVVQSGDTALFDCKVSLLRDKTVSWLKRQPGEPPRLLTVGAQTYAGDSRFTVQFRYPNNWRLQISPANTSDEGVYECQLSTHPPRVISVYLQVRSMSVAIVDDAGEPLREQYYEVGSTLSLRCSLRGGDNEVSSEGAVWWFHGSKALHRDASRGGVGVRSVALKDGNGADSTLRVSRLSAGDAGNYTCAVPHALHYAYTVLVHVLNESLAELQQGSSNEGPRSFTLLAILGFLIAILFSNTPS